MNNANIAKKARNVAAVVSEIIRDVKKNGDKALFKFEKRFNGVTLTSSSIKYTKKDFSKAFEKLPPAARKHLKKIAQRILRYQKKIASVYKDVLVRRGSLKIKHRFIPIETVALYVPSGTGGMSGRFYYPSSIIMNAMPAMAVGVKKIYAATPAVSDVVLGCCWLSGVSSLYRISGAQAIASFAFGTESVPKADFIAGPGNVYVTEAKRQLQGTVGIDVLAGPSEIAVIADESVEKEWLLYDIAAQLEHAPEARAFLITPSKVLYNFIKGVFGRRVSVFHIKSANDQIKKLEEIAPEHALIMTENPSNYSGKINKSGAVFLGKYSAVAMGDYTAGPSHTLPTAGGAVFSSGLNPGTFLRSSAEISYDKKSFETDAAAAAFLAEAEGMFNHRKSIIIRGKKL